MTWTYTNAPADFPRDELRFLIGDTDEDDQQLSDEEIAYLLSNSASTKLAAIASAQILQSKYARLTSKSVGGLSISYGERQAHYKAMETRFRSELGLLVAPFAGGISKSSKTLLESDTDFNDTLVKLGMHDYPGTGYTNST